MPLPDRPARLALATCAARAWIDPDDAHLAATLAQLGAPPTVCVWNDAQVDWSAFDLVLIRTIWDYHQHHAAFGQWLDRLDRLGIATVNDSRLLRWNSDKRYLFELARLGVATIPTRLAHGGELARVLASMPDASVVVKPTISGGAWQTLRGEVGDAAFAAAVAQLPTAMEYLVQPYLPEIASAGEWSLLYFGGEYSHAVIKRPAAGDYRVQDEHGGRSEAATPDAATRAAAERALAAVAAAGHDVPAYARVDGVVSGGRFMLMELELIEPSLFLAAQPRAAERFAHLLADHPALRRAALASPGP
ncbi:ATP-grasp domain-containing protein [Rhodanobacter lindaniclasticus]|uniref:ATP-grasp domain-containing protein n=1 Tax=Rhodanobacter lindaniclasticus TaxID=75310 RepID=A0A4S3KE91_9GAMM|nr:hypothetical protein [Rhodanobacter lindaniclasticus]THD06817.1 hypothetical protein B1991_10775 [Rhodanobacter lindaniclasticus]